MQAHQDLHALDVVPHVQDVQGVQEIVNQVVMVVLLLVKEIVQLNALVNVKLVQQHVKTQNKILFV